MQVTGTIRIPFVVNGVDGTNGKGISGVTNYYARSASATSAPSTSSFTTSIPTLNADYPYMWNYELTTYTDGTTTTTTPHIVAYYAEDGRGIKDITEYYARSTTTGQPAASSFTTSIPVIDEEYRYLWNYEKITYDDGDTTTTTPHIIGVYGEGGVSLQLTPEIVVFDADTTKQEIEARGFVGSGQVELNASNLTVTSHVDDDGITIDSVTGSSDGTATITVSQYKRYTDKAEGYITVSAPVGSVTLTRYIAVRTVTDGAKGDKGDKGDNGDKGDSGEDAVTYKVVASATTAVLYRARRAYTPDSVTFTFYQTKGTTTTAMSVWWKVVLTNQSNGEVTVWSEGSSYTVDLTGNTDFIVKRVEVQAYASQGSESTMYVGCSATVTVTTSCQPRVLVWEDQEDGFQFECGDVGDTYIDTVIYGGDGTTQVQRDMYQCIKTHKKNSDSDEPTVGTKWGNYWQQVNWFDNVATNLLLANYAYIKNLVADDVYMETDDGLTAIWINPALNGMKILRMGSGWKSGRENTEGNDWANPTSWFHGGEVPSLEELFGGTREGNFFTIPAKTIAASGDNNNNTSMGVLIDNTVTANSISVKKGETYAITMSDTQSAFSVREGTNTSTITHSTGYLELRLYEGSSSGGSSSRSYVSLMAWTLAATGGTNTTTYISSGTLEYSYTATADTTLYVEVWHYGWTKNAGSVIAIASPIPLYAARVGGTYVSQFGADGVFLGRNYKNYIRAGVSDGAASLHVISDGSGLVVDEGGALYQIQSLQRLPLGMTLMTGYVEFSGATTLTGHFRTFDGSAVELHHFGSAGYCQLILPLEWVSVFGAFDPERYSVQLTPMDNDDEGYYMMHVHYNTAFSSGRGDIEIMIYNRAGSRACCNFYVTILYIGDGTVVEGTASS